MASQAKRQRAGIDVLPLLFKLRGQEKFLLASLHGAIYDFFTLNDWLAFAFSSQSANLAFQRHLASTKCLTFTEDDEPDILLAALRHCRKLTTLVFPRCWFNVVAEKQPQFQLYGCVEKLIVLNAATFQGVRRPGKDYYIRGTGMFQALSACPNLRELFCFEAPMPLMTELMARPSLLTLGLPVPWTTYQSDFFKVPLSLTRLHASVTCNAHLEHIAKMPSLTELSITAYDNKLDLEVLEQLPSLTDLRISTHYNTKALPLTVLRLPGLRKLRLSGSVLERIIVKSQCLEIAQFPYDDDDFDSKSHSSERAIPMGFSMLLETKACHLRALSLPGSVLEVVSKTHFLSMCAQWSNLTFLDFSPLDLTMFRAIAKYCRQLEVLRTHHAKEVGVNDWLAVLTLPRLQELSVIVSDEGEMLFNDGTEAIGDMELPAATASASFEAPIVCAHLVRLNLPFLSQRLLDCIRCPSLRYLTSARSCRKLYLDGLVLGSAHSLLKLKVNFPVDFRNIRKLMTLSRSPAFLTPSASHLFSPWSLFSKLKAVEIDQPDLNLARTLLRQVPSLTSLSLVTGKRVYDIADIVQSTHPSLSLISLNERPQAERYEHGDDDEDEVMTWYARMWHEVLPPLLRRERLPPALVSIELHDVGVSEDSLVYDVRKRKWFNWLLRPMVGYNEDV